MANGYFVVQNGLTVGSLSIDATTGDINTSGNVNITGNLGVSQIAKNDSSVTINDTGSGSNVTFTVDGVVEHVMTGSLTTLNNALTVNGNIVAAQGTASTSTTTGALVVVGGAGVSGNATIGGSAVISGDAYVQGGDIFTSAATFNLINDTATTVNAFGAATTLNTGNAGGTTNMAGIVKHTGNLVAASSTASTNFNLGALVVVGGAGIGGAVYAGSINSPVGNVTTLVAPNFSSSNAQVTGTGSYFGTGASLVNSVYGTTGYFTNLSSANISGVTNSSVTTEVATNFSTANVRITGGYVQNLANITATTGYIVNENITNGNATTLVATNFSTANAQITGTGSYLGTGASLVNSVYGTTGYFTNLSSANIDAVTNMDSITSVATNFSTGNIVATGGSVNNVTVGATTATTGRFTTLTATTVNAGTIGNTGATLTGTISTATQNSITTMGGLVSFGTNNISTVAQGDFTVTGNLTVQGLNQAVGSQNLTVADSLIELHTYANLAPWTVDDGRDIGIRFHYYKGFDRNAALIWENTSEQLHWYANATEVSSNISGTLGTMGLGELFVSNSTVSTSSSTGALRVTGGAGISGAMYNGSTITASGNIVAASGTASSSTTTGALVVVGGAGVSGATYLGSTLSVTGTSTVAAVTASGTVQPNANSTVALGSTSNYWSNFYASAITTNGITVGASGGILPAANLTVNIGSASAWFNTFYGVSTQAKYADLAENYMGDKSYAPGTVVMFGGTQEITVADADTTAVAGVVSTNPAHLMNGQLTGATVVPLALQGRVPCMVIGPIKKGDMLVSAGFGYAKASANPQMGQVIGKALQDYSAQGKAVIEVVVGRV